MVCGVGLLSPALHLTVLVVGRGHDATALEAALHPVHPNTEALLPRPPVVVDQPCLDHLLHGDEHSGLVEEDHDTADGLHSEEDEDEGDEECHPSPGGLDRPADSGDADTEDQAAGSQQAEADQSEQVLTSTRDSRHTARSYGATGLRAASPAADIMVRKVPLLL